MKKLLFLIATILIAPTVDAMSFARRAFNVGTKTAYLRTIRAPITQLVPQTYKPMLSTNNRFGLKAVALGLGLFSLSKGNDYYEKRIAALKDDQALKKQKLAFSNESLTTLYRLSNGFIAYIPMESSSKYSPESLKEFFEKNKCVTDLNCMLEPKKWSEQDWTNLSQRLVMDSNEITKLHQTIPLEQLPELLAHAKLVLKSFVPTENPDPIDGQFTEKYFIKKRSDIGRLLTYAKLQQVIDQNKLSHIHLPLKVLVIKDLKTNTYITGNRALKILDDMMKIYIVDSFGFGTIGLVHTDYQLQVLAHKQKRGPKLSEEAFKDLQILISQAPFDVGDDNIFSNDNGDAVIIDTEFKGESAKSSLPKLARYRKNLLK